jgi:predicted double-glycine peptidase
MVMHFVVLMEMDEQGVKLGDPMLGEVDYSREEFMGKWARSVVVLE